MLVVDASVLVVALLDDEDHGDRARARLRGHRLAVPALADVEVASVLRRHVAAGLVAEGRAQSALADLIDLPADRFPHPPLLTAAWRLRANVTIYDAVYVALAEALGAVLLTGDAKLAHAPGVSCDIEIL